MNVEQLVASGYSPISNSGLILCRLDRPDWREHMADQHHGGMEWVNALGAGAADHYRRVYSQDKTVVSSRVYGEVKANINRRYGSNGPTHYLAIESGTV